MCFLVIIPSVFLSPFKPGQLIGNVLGVFGRGKGLKTYISSFLLL